MNLRDLKYLVTVADLGHFGKAAEACHVSQPTLSMQLKKLEEFLGVTLIERGSRQVMLTPIGEGIVEEARQIVERADQLVAHARESQDPLSGDFKLGAFPTIAPYLFPLVIPHVKELLPKLKLLLIEEKTATLLTQLKSGEIDAALIALPVEDPGLYVRELFEEPFDLAVPENHPLAEKKTVTYEDVKPHPLLLLEEGHCLREQALDLCRRVGVREDQNFRATSLETLRHMVAGGVAATLVPRLAVKQAGTEPVRYIPFANPVPSRRIALVCRKRFPRKEILRILGGLIRRETDLYLSGNAS